eukprot:3030779-Amphidinium_carterae.1
MAQTNSLLFYRVYTYLILVEAGVGIDWSDQAYYILRHRPGCGVHHIFLAWRLGLWMMSSSKYSLALEWPHHTSY